MIWFHGTEWRIPGADYLNKDIWLLQLLVNDLSQVVCAKSETWRAQES